MRRHVAAAAGFVGFSVAWTFPLAWHGRTHLPGGGLGDNVDGLWNFWWMRVALSTPADFFSTRYLFAPVGTDLTLHTHTALPAFLGATLFGDLSIVTAQNAAIVLGVFLNAFCAYLLAWRITRDAPASLIAGVIFGGSPYIAEHLHGHFNLTHAWTLPLFAMAAAQMLAGSSRWALVAGLVLGLTAYIDYYYVVFAIVIGLCSAACAARQWTVVLSGSSRWSRLLAGIVAALIALDLLLMTVILVTGGISEPIGPIRSARSVFNPLQVFWILLVVLLLLLRRPRVTALPRSAWHEMRAGSGIALAAVVFLAAVAPLAWNGAALLLRDDYVTQEYRWRSAPAGVDVGTLVLGSPFHPLWGENVRGLYGAIGIPLTESSAWLGLVPMLLLGSIMRRHLHTSPISGADATGASGRALRDAAWHWLFVGALFFVWALGPHLTAFGENTAMILPQAVARYVPILNNARIPGRAMVVVYLALGVLAAMALAEWRARSRRPTLVAAAAALGVIIDYVPAPLPTVAMTHPAIYDTVRARAEPGAVCELPLGLRDGFGIRGAFQDAVLYYQTIHERPIVGGFVARLPRGVMAAYAGDPLLSALLQLSTPDADDDGVAPPDRNVAAEWLRRDDIAFVVLDRARATPPLSKYVETVLPLVLIEERDGRALFRVESVPQRSGQ